MPFPDDNDQVSDPSTETTLDDAQDLNLDNGADDGANGSDSSDERGENEGSSTLDVVRDVVKSRDPAASPAEGQKDGEDPAGTGTDDKGAKEPDDEDYSDAPFHKHPRFQHLMRRMKTYKVDAERYQNVQGFLDKNGIAPEEAAEGFTIMAAMRQDPVKAWEMLKPHVQLLLQAAGEVLPEDLSKRVQDGELTVEAARELAKANARVRNVEAGRTFEQQQRERQEQQERAKSIHDTAITWAQDRAKKDPNFDAKQPALMREVAYLQQIEGKPDTPEGVKAQLEKAYKAIAPAIRPNTTPAPKVGEAVRPRVAASTGASGTAQPRPASTLDIINGVLAKRAG